MLVALSLPPSTAESSARQSYQCRDQRPLEVKAMDAQIWCEMFNKPVNQGLFNLTILF